MNKTDLLIYCDWLIDHNINTNALRVIIDYFGVGVVGMNQFGVDIGDINEFDGGDTSFTPDDGYGSGDDDGYGYGYWGGDGLGDNGDGYGYGYGGDFGSSLSSWYGLGYGFDMESDE